MSLQSWLLWPENVPLSVLLLLVVGVFALMGIRKVKRVKAPARTIATSKDTVAYLKANTRRG